MSAPKASAASNPARARAYQKAGSAPLIGLVLTPLFSLVSLLWTGLAVLAMILFASQEVMQRQDRRLSGWWSFGLGTGCMMISSVLVPAFALLTVRKVVLEEELAVDSEKVRALRERLFGNWEMNEICRQYATATAQTGSRPISCSSNAWLSGIAGFRPAQQTISVNRLGR